MFYICKICVILFHSSFSLVSYFHHCPSLSALTGSLPSLQQLSSFRRTISLKSTQKNFSPSNSFQRHLPYLSTRFKEKSHSYLIRVLNRNGSNVSCNRDECNQAGFDGLMTESMLHLWVESDIIFGSNITFFKKSFSLICR